MTTVLNLDMEEKNQGTLQYPFLLIEGLAYEIEFQYFKDSQKGELPLYIKLDDEFLYLGTANLDHILFTNLLRISKGSYKLFLYKNENNFTEIDYKNSEAALAAMKVR